MPANIEAWASILLQIPIVGAFIIFCLYIVRLFLAALDKRDESFEKRQAGIIQAFDRQQAAITQAIANLNDVICSENVSAKAAANAAASSAATAAANTTAQGAMLAAIQLDIRAIRNRRGGKSEP